MSKHIPDPPEDLAGLIKRLEEHGRHQRPFADTTRSNLNYIMKKWSQYCIAASFGDPDDALRNSSAATLKAFFQWMIWNPERGPQQALSLKQYFRRLKQAYADVTGTALDDRVVVDVNAYIDHYAEGKKKTSPRPKPVPSGADFVQMLHFLYAHDRTRYPDERQRVQQAFLMLVHGYSGVRPSTTTRTGKRALPVEADDADTKLRYGDFVVLLKKDERGSIRFGVRVHFTRFKGEKHRAQRKMFTWWDQADLLSCPVSHLIALALHDHAFKQPQLTTAESILSLKIPGQGQQLKLHWKESCLDRPIFRMTCNDGSEEELSNSVASKRLHSLGKRKGLEESLTWYCFRRMVLNAVDGNGSDEVRNQVSGHLESRTYRAAYQDHNIGLDVANLVLGNDTDDTLTQQVNYMGAYADPDADVAPTKEALEQIASFPDILALHDERVRLATLIKAQFDTISRAPADNSLVQQHAQAINQMRARKAYYKTKLEQRMRAEYFERKDDALISVQFGELTDHDLSQKRLPFAPKIPERQLLARLDRTSDIRADPSRANAVQALADLCSRIDDGEFQVYDCLPSPPHSSNKQARIESTTAAQSTPMACDPLQCLFCLGDTRRRAKPFNRVQALWKHAGTHLKTLADRDIPCPHPICKARGEVFNNLQHLMHHAHEDHKIRLQSERG